MNPILLTSGLVGAKAFRALPLQKKLDNRGEYPPLDFEEVISTANQSDKTRYGNKIVEIQALLEGNKDLEKFFKIWPPYQDRLRKLNAFLQYDGIESIKESEFKGLKKGLQFAIDLFPKAINVGGIYLLNDEGRASALEFKDKVDKAIKAIQVAGFTEYARFVESTKIVNINPGLVSEGRAFVFDRWTDIRSVENYEWTASTLIHEGAHHESKVWIRGGLAKDDYEFTIHPDDAKNLHGYSTRINTFINEAYSYLAQEVFEVDYVNKFTSFGLDEARKRFQRLDPETSIEMTEFFLKYLKLEEAQAHIKDEGREIISAMLASFEVANSEYLALKQQLGIE
jgi:hypothetical protein